MFITKSSVCFELHRQYSFDYNRDVAYLDDHWEIIEFDMRNIWGNYISSKNKLKSVPFINLLSAFVSDFGVSYFGDDNDGFVLHVYNSLDGGLVFDVIDATKLAETEVTFSKRVYATEGSHKIDLNKHTLSNSMESVLDSVLKDCELKRVSEIYYVLSKSSNLGDFTAFAWKNAKLESFFSVDSGDVTVVLVDKKLIKKGIPRGFKVIDGLDWVYGSEI